MKLDFKINGWCQVLILKNSASIIKSQQKQLFAQFFVLKVGWFVEKFEGHESLFKWHSCPLQSINLCLANILPKVFEVSRFPCISLTFENTFGLLGLYVDVNGKIQSFFIRFSLLIALWELREFFQFPFQQPFLDIFEFSVKWFSVS